MRCLRQLQDRNTWGGTSKYTCTETIIDVYTHTHTHSLSHSAVLVLPPHVLAHTHTHTHTHMRTHTHTHTHTHAHTHTPLPQAHNQQITVSTQWQQHDAVVLVIHCQTHDNWYELPQLNRLSISGGGLIPTTLDGEVRFGPLTSHTSQDTILVRTPSLGVCTPHLIMRCIEWADCNMLIVRTIGS